MIAAIPPTSAELRLDALSLHTLRKSLETALATIDELRAEPPGSRLMMMDTTTYKAMAHLALERIRELELYAGQSSERRN